MRFRIFPTPFISMLLASSALAIPALAQFDIPWSTIDAGGGTSAGGTFSLLGVIGQPDAGPTMTGGVFSLSGGFLAGGTAMPRCPADMDDGTGTGTPDGGVTIEDLLFFLDQFADGNIRADLDDGSNTGTPDGGVTIEDILYFLQRFSDGC